MAGNTAALYAAQPQQGMPSDKHSRCDVRPAVTAAGSWHFLTHGCRSALLSTVAHGASEAAQHPCSTSDHRQQHLAHPSPRVSTHKRPAPCTQVSQPSPACAPLILSQAQEYTNLSRGRLNRTELERPAIAVCHSFPDCWRMQRDVPAMGVPGCPCPPENDKARAVMEPLCRIPPG